MSSLNFFLSFKDKFNWLSFFPTIAGFPCFPIIILDLNKWISSTKFLFNNSVKKIPPASTNKSDIFNEYILLKIFFKFSFLFLFNLQKIISHPNLIKFSDFLFFFRSKDNNSFFRYIF